MRLAALSDAPTATFPRSAPSLPRSPLNGWTGTVNLGDCAPGPLWPAAAVAVLRNLGWPTVPGSHDRWSGNRPTDVLADPTHSPGARSTPTHDNGSRGFPRHLRSRAPSACSGLMDDDETCLPDEIRNGHVAIGSARRRGTDPVYRNAACALRPQPRSASLHTRPLCVSRIRSVYLIHFQSRLVKFALNQPAPCFFNVGICFLDQTSKILLHHRVRSDIRTLANYRLQQVFRRHLRCRQR